MSAKATPSLDGFIQTKGASRPDAMQQRGTSSSTAPEPEAPPAMPVRPAQAPEPRAKALTLRLSESQYQRLRRFAFDRGLSHQDVLEQALMDLLGRSGS
ncbi:hypothetical protein [Methylobacterium thuringiense]|uniref:CopG family transcriptional regulator n=1 Tax=Methylobacterium thuringiense TaxID=1003091 RepID=A0ABQ4TRH7_9HYPH|nr:hypothetical protein [Methylobacterium thuringiense]GJE57760.1 hypothetical protein EKPJFOCH_4278 [Methylobacterium thuringiense]